MYLNMYWIIVLVNDDGRQDDTIKAPVLPADYFTYQYTHSTSYTCGSSEAGVILQDWDTPAELKQVSKFNSTNQNKCSG